MIEPRPITPFKKKPIEIKSLPSWCGKPVEIKIDVSMLEKAELSIHQAWTTISIGTKVGWAFIKAALIIDTFLTQTKDSKMDERWFESRRVWATVFSVITVALGIFKITIPEQVASVGPDIMVTIATAIAGVITGVLAIISWFKPKPTV